MKGRTENLISPTNQILSHFSTRNIYIHPYTNHLPVIFLLLSTLLITTKLTFSISIYREQNIKKHSIRFLLTETHAGKMFVKKVSKGFPSIL